MKNLLSVLCGIVIIILILTIGSIATVPTGYVGVKTRFGKVQSDVIQEGLNLKAPFIEKIVKIDCKTNKLNAETESSSKDLQTVKVTVTVNYNVNKEIANKLYQEVGLDYESKIIEPAVYESIKAAMAQYNAEEMITRRSEVSNSIQEKIIEKIGGRGFIVTEFNLTEIDFSEEFDKAIENKAVKQQEVETAKAELEKQKIQNEKEISTAEKDARVMELQNSQITENTLRLKELEVKQKLIEKWNGGLPTTILGDNMSGLFNLGQ